MQQLEQVRMRVNQCVQRANAVYGINLSDVEVRFDLRGRSAGQAMRKAGRLIVRFNSTYILLGGKTLDHILHNTVPHEIAHIACYVKPELGIKHNDGWKRVCITLGGNGQRCYTPDDAPEAYAHQRPFVYTSTTGHKIPVTPLIHKRIQSGRSYATRGLGQLHKNCEYHSAKIAA